MDGALPRGNLAFYALSLPRHANSTYKLTLFSQGRIRYLTGEEDSHLSKKMAFGSATDCKALKGGETVPDINEAPQLCPMLLP